MYRITTALVKPIKLKIGKCLLDWLEIYLLLLRTVTSSKICNLFSGCLSDILHRVTLPTLARSYALVK